MLAAHIISLVMTRPLIPQRNPGVLKQTGSALMARLESHSDSVQAVDGSRLFNRCERWLLGGNDWHYLMVPSWMCSAEAAVQLANVREKLNRLKHARVWVWDARGCAVGCAVSHAAGCIASWQRSERVDEILNDGQSIVGDDALWMELHPL